MLFPAHLDPVTEPNSFTSVSTAESTLLLPNEFMNKQMTLSSMALFNLFRLCKMALENFIQGRLEQHDALVGENACHIRALALIDISEKLHCEIFRRSIKNVVFQLEKKLMNIQLLPFQKLSDNKTITEYLNKNALVFSFPALYLRDFQFIIYSHILTLTKEQNSPIRFTLNEKTTHQPLLNMGFVRNKIKALIKSTQKALSALSCDYIKSEAAHLTNPIYTFLLETAYDAHERSYLPQFFAAKVIIERMLTKKRPLILKVNRHVNGAFADYLNILCYPNSRRNDFERISDEHHITCRVDTHAMIFNAVVDYRQTIETVETYKSRLFQHSLVESLLANFASHPQYSGEIRHLPLPFFSIENAIQQKFDHQEASALLPLLTKEKNDFKTKKHLAEQRGCSINNPSLLFLNHIYSDRLKNHHEIYDNRALDIQQLVHLETGKELGNINYN